MPKGDKNGIVNGLDKVKDSKYIYKRLWSYLVFYKKRIILTLFFSIIANVFSLVGPILSGSIIDEISKKVNDVPSINFKQIYFLAALMICFYIISALLSYLMSILMVRISQKIIYKLRSDLFESLSYVKISFFGKTQTGDIIARMSYDIDSISTTLSSDSLSLISSFFVIVISFIMMIIIKPVLVLVFLITIPITFLITNFLSKLIRARYRKRNKLLGDLSGYAEEMISGQKTIASFGVEKEVIKKYSEINKECAEAMKSSGQVSTLSGPLVNFISNFSMSLVALFSGILYFFEQITIGKVTSFMLYSRRFSGPINQISNLLADIQSGLAACERVFIYIDLPRDISDNQLDSYVSPFNGSDIEFKDVNFAYEANNYVLKNINFKAFKGKTTAIVGHTGSGKTTLISLIMRFYDEYLGEIKLDNIDINGLKKGDTRKAITMILQDSWLFNGTIRENITYGNSAYTEEEIEVALKNANIYKFVTRLKDGIDTYLSDDGIKISKGEKQLLVICRAFLSKNKMLILDEATSNVDTFTERKIHSAITELMVDKTCFVIAHRLSTIRNADMIIVMENGEIVEIGTNTELIEKKGKYFEILSSQYL